MRGVCERERDATLEFSHSFEVVLRHWTGWAGGRGVVCSACGDWLSEGGGGVYLLTPLFLVGLGGQ